MNEFVFMRSKYCLVSASPFLTSLVDNLQCSAAFLSAFSVRWYVDIVYKSQSTCIDPGSVACF